MHAIEANIGISQLVARYAMAADSRDIETLVQLFVPELRADWQSWIESTLRTFRRSIHQIFGHRIDLDPDDPGHATGALYGRAEHEFDIVGSSWRCAISTTTASSRASGCSELFGGQSSGMPEIFRDATVRRLQLLARSGCEPKCVRRREVSSRLPEVFPTWAPFWNRNA